MRGVRAVPLLASRTLRALARGVSVIGKVGADAATSFPCRAG